MTSKLKKLFKTYHGSVLFKAWSHILQIVCFYVLAMIVDAFQAHFSLF